MFLFSFPLTLHYEIISIKEGNSLLSCKFPIVCIFIQIMPTLVRNFFVTLNLCTLSNDQIIRSVCMYVRYIREAESTPWGLKMWKICKKTKSRESSTAPFRTNPIASTATHWNCDCVGKKLGQMIVAGFRRISTFQKGWFPWITSIFGEYAYRASWKKPFPHHFCRPKAVFCKFL